MNTTALDVIKQTAPQWSIHDVREHLNSFLFQKNDEVNKLVIHLSGGEKVRLSLAKIAVNAPDLLILDEITNNLDIETKDYVIDALNAYSGAIIVVSHEDEFVRAINADDIVEL